MQRFFWSAKVDFWSWIRGKTNCGMWVWEISEFGGKTWNGSEGERETSAWLEKKIRKIGEGGRYWVWKWERTGEGLLYTYRERESFGKWPMGVWPRSWLSKFRYGSYDLTILRIFQGSFDRSGSVGSYDSNNPKRSWFLLIFFNLIKDSFGSKWKIKSQ